MPANAPPSSPLGRDCLSRRQLHALIALRSRWPDDEFIWHPRTHGLLLEVRAQAYSHRWTRAVVRFTENDCVELDRPISAGARARAQRA